MRKIQVGLTGRRQVIAAVLIAMISAGCAQGEDAQTAPGGTTSPDVPEQGAPATELDSAVEEARLRTEAVTRTPDDLLRPPLSDVVPSGKRILHMVCGVPVCESKWDGAEEAVAALGWEQVRIPLGFAPEDFTEAFDEAVLRVQQGEQVDGIISTNIRPEQVEQQLAFLDSRGIPIIYHSIPEENQVGVTTVVIRGTTYMPLAAGQLADWMLVDNNGPYSVLNVWLPLFEAERKFKEGLEDYVATTCDGCIFRELTAGGEDIGTQLPGAVVAFLQNNPDVQYITGSFSDLFIGLPQALRDAGLDGSVKIVTGNATADAVAGVAAGDFGAARSAMPQYMGWELMDRFARFFIGDVYDYEDYPSFIATPENTIGNFQDPDFGSVTDYREKFKALWTVG